MYTTYGFLITFVYIIDALNKNLLSSSQHNPERCQYLPTTVWRIYFQISTPLLYQTSSDGQCRFLDPRRFFLEKLLEYFWSRWRQDWPSWRQLSYWLRAHFRCFDHIYRFSYHGSNNGGHTIYHLQTQEVNGPTQRPTLKQREWILESSSKQLNNWIH